MKYEDAKRNDFCDRCFHVDLNGIYCHRTKKFIGSNSIPCQKAEFKEAKKIDATGIDTGNQAIKRFFDTDTYKVDRGYTIHISRAPEYTTEAVVEDADGKMTLVDVSTVEYEDFDSFVDAIVDTYESLGE